MKNKKGKPICGANTDPLDPRTGRPARVWHHSHCKRVVKNEDERCWQHRPRPASVHPLRKAAQ